MYHRFGHAQAHFVKLGDKVKKGQKILSIGTGNGQWSAHCHYDCPIEKLVSWESYVFGMSEERVCAAYADPRKKIKTVMPEFDHFGFEYLQHANYGTAKVPKWCFHPGVDLNGKGSGNSDLGDLIYSPCDGIVVHDDDDGKALNGGWGKLLVIQEIEEAPKLDTEQTPKIETPAPKVDEVVTIPVKIEMSPMPIQIPDTRAESITVPEEIKSEVVPIDLKFIISKLCSYIWSLIKKRIDRS